MEGQFFFTTIAGLSMSIAGFASLIAWLRADAGKWDPINLWRVKAIIREAFTLVFLSLALIPIFSLTNDLRATIRWASAVMMLAIVIEIFLNRHPDPAIWKPRVSWWAYMVGGGIYFAVHLVNIRLASLGLLQTMFLLTLASPAGIFSNFVRELGRNSSSTGEGE